ncbi:hypothetical protein DYB37_011726, partial [Aphanomyces astaci]
MYPGSYTETVVDVKLDKNQQFIKDLEDKKRKAREDDQAKADKQRRLRLKLRKSILQRAASIRTTDVGGGADDVESSQPQDETAEAPEEAVTDDERRAKAGAQKKLLQKQQALLEGLKAKREKDAEDAEMERQKALKKKELTRKASLGTTEVPSRMQEALEKFNQAAAAGSAVSAVRVKKEEKDDVSSLTPDEREKRSIKKKQVEYLQKLADERKQRQVDDDEKNELVRQKRAKVREEALLKHEAAKAEKLAAAAAAAGESTSSPVVEVEEAKPKVNVEAMVSRLSKLKTSEAQLVPEAKDFTSWKKRNGVALDTKVFCLTGWYPVIKETLEKRGWHHNPDRNSPYFDLKWALKSDDLKSVKLNDDQLVNHFLQNTAITTKSGLLHNLRKYATQSYYMYFRYIHAEGMLKRLGDKCRNANALPHVNAGVLDVLLSVCRKRQEILPDDILDNPLACGTDAIHIYFMPELHLMWVEAAFIQEKTRLNGLLGQVVPLSTDTATKVLELLAGLEELCPQFHLNGGGDSKNVWIVKPAGMSRGRGIRVFNQLHELLEYADVENHKECQWIVQKYIENPLLVCNRKFDIRQWVFVTSWNPLTVWFYLDCYLRFSSEEYQVDDLSDQYVHLTNNSIQKNGENFYRAYTTEDGSMTVEGCVSNMWHSDELTEHLTRKYGVDPDTNQSLFTSKIQPRMKEIVKWSLSCVQDTVQHRKNSCELYGYDFMLDDKLKVIC